MKVRLALVAVVLLIAGAASTSVIAATGTSGQLHIWGSDFYGQLGTGKGGIYPGGTWPASVDKIEVGDKHVLVLDNGDVWAAGSTEEAQTGTNVLSAGCNGTFVCNPRPVKLPNLSNITHISAGVAHNLALRGDGTVLAWGLNTSGQLGSTTNQTACFNVGACRYGAEVVPGLLEIRTIGGAAHPANTYVRDVAAGGDFSLVVKQGTDPKGAFGADDAVWGWGNLHGYITDSGFNTTSLSPAPIRGMTNVRSVSAGPAYALAVK